VTVSSAAGGAPQRKSFLLRLDGELYAELRRWAAADLRSVNGQIEFILRRWVNERKKPEPPQS
jgi:hypothetical protein